MAQTVEYASPKTSTADSRPKDKFVKHAGLISKLTMVSRVAGLLRDKVCSSYLGIGTEWSAFWIGFQFPNLFRRIFGEGALTAIFVPTYTRILHEKGQDAANRLAAATCTLLVIFLTALTLLGELVLVPMAFSADVMPANRLAAGMVALMLPYCVLVCLVALLGAIASVHERFAQQALSPIVLNVLMTLAAGVPVWLGSKEYPLEKRIVWVALSVVAAGLIQVVLMLPSVWKSGVSLWPRLDFRGSGVGEIVKAMLPMMVGLSAVQFNTFMDTQIAWWLSPDGHDHLKEFMLLGWKITVPMGDGAVAKLSVAQRIYMLPVGIFGVAMATAIFPKFAKAVAADDMPELKRLLILGLRKTLFLSLPASFGMILIAKPLITLIYSGRAVTPAEIDRAAWATGWFCAGIWAFELQLVVLRVFYALRDTMTPMKIAVWMVLLNFTLNITLVWFLQEGGLAASTTLAAIVQSSVLLWILRKRLGALGLGQLKNSLWKGLVACGVMVAVAGYAKLLVPVSSDLPRGRQLLLTLGVQLPVVMLTAGGLYGLMAILLRMPEVEDLPVIGKRLRRKQV